MRRALSLLAAEAVLLSVFHHWLDFWGLPWDKQVLLILVGGPILAFLISFLLTPVWNDLLKIEWRRWLLFFFPALMIASAVAWQLFSVPEVQHQLAIIPVGIDAPATIQISELKAAYGNVIPLSSFTNFAGWTMKDNGLLVGDTSADPIHYSFNGPIDQQVRVTFLTSPDSGSVKVVLDGNVQNIDLRGSIGDQRRARMDTQYLWGSLNFLIGPIIVSADLLTVLFLLTSIWMIQEIAQRHSVVSEQRKPDAFLSHRDGLLILCSLALVFHVVNFFAVPLTVFIKDSPSYLQGVAYWIRFHSLDGVSSFRGPGTTFLFIPVVAPFGKSPLGLKFLLHFLAFACIPINYRIGWQVGGRRWFAFFAGLLTILMPDLYLYSNMVVSEIPHVFFELLFITTLISALETMSFAWMVIALLVGSFSVLVRSESAVSLILGIVFLFVNILRETMIQQEALPYNHKDFLSNSFNHLWRFGLAILVAGAPLLVWSIHNEKIYGFFGVSNYLGEILFDGWIYYGQNSHIPIVDPNSPAVHDINSVYPLQPDRMKNVPTGWAYYRFLLRHGYTGEQAFSLLGQAAIDSILKNPQLAFNLMVIKIQDGLQPQIDLPDTFPLPGEKLTLPNGSMEYFDREKITVPALIKVQRYMDNLLRKLYQNVYTVWLWSGLLMLGVCFYREPSIIWLPLALIAFVSVFLANTLGVASWRYVFPGSLLLPMFVLSGFQSFGRFALHYWHSIEHEVSN